MKKDKLVRDFIPDIITAKGEFADFYVAEDDDEYFQKLKEKIVEELDEILYASREELTEELADLKEVVLAIAKFKKILIEKLDIENTVDIHLKDIKIKIENCLCFIKYISKLEGISLQEIEEKRMKKKIEKGGFEKRLILINR